MYRLLSLRKIKIRQLNGMTLQKNEIKSRLNVNERTCTFCKQLSGFPTTSIRHQSTNANPIVKPPRKKRLRGIKKYTDVLVVTDKSSSEYRTKLKKLTSEDLNFLAMTNLNLGELYKLKKMMDTNKAFEERTYNNLTIIESPPVIETASSTITTPVQPVIVPSVNIENNLHIVINNSENLDINVTKIFEKEPLHEDKKEDISSSGIIGDLETFQTVIPNAFQPETVDEEPHEIVETIEDIKNNQKKRNEREAKKEVISRTLASYIEICSVFGIYHKGIEALHLYKLRLLKNDTYPTITNVNVYNAALKGAAAIGDRKNLKDTFKYAKSLNVVFNVQSYGAVFECLGRDARRNGKDINFFAKEAIANGFTFDKIMNEGIFTNDEREQILNAMRVYDNNYIPKYIPPNVQYSNPLLDHLNNEEQFNYHSKNAELGTGIFTKEKMREFIEKQIETEKIGYVTVRSIDKRNEPTAEILKCRTAVENHLEMWKSVAKKAFKRDLLSLTSKRQTEKLQPYIQSIPLEDVVNIMVEEAKLIAQGSETYSPTANQLHRELGNKVYARYKILRKERTKVLDKIMKIHTKYCDDFVSYHNELDVLPKEPQNFNTRQMWQRIEFDEKPHGSSIELDHQAWVPSVLVAVGKYLYSIIMHDMKVDSNVMKVSKKPKNFVPAFYTIFRHQGRIIKEEVKPHPILSKLYRASEPETLTFPTYQVPMKCPPIPWSTLAVGGYLVTPTDFVRLPPQALTQRQRLQAATPQQLYPSYDALNQLAAVPWQVNKKILSVILDVFIKGGSAKLSVPEHPATLPIPISHAGIVDKQEKFKILRQRLQYRRKKAEMYSLWCDCLYRLSLANHFKEDIFWLPHNMDFRGRVYPVPPHLNHLGSDLARSMLVFAESRPLGPNGLDWLKIHLVNLTGMKKRDSVHDRLVFANEIMDKILDSADNPLTGKMWWAQSDEPWQTLACCMEIAAASRSGDPEKYKSHFPVHQDGSCNGLQHYAALGRDSAGGHSVNLTPASKPQDVYSAVAALVEERRHQDAENGVEIAKVLKGFVRRKVIKQTVMTTVYGVTRFGARLQIARQLKDIDDFPKESVWAGSMYLTTRTFESLKTMFTSTREIQDWFTECARLISSVCCENVEWVTPLGLPIVQPYFKYKALPNNMTFEAFHMDKYERPNVMKQKNAFPPNFIHSLDSSHMMLTSLHCERAGITFVSVHDCYWTHPSTVHIMNKICREQFVALHSEPILEELSLFLSEKYSYSSEDLPHDGSVTDLAKRKLNKVLKKLPKTGDFNIENVLDSVYFFS